MEATIQIGKLNSLKINRKEPQGFYLGAKDESEVLLPNAYVNIKYDIGDEMDVFIYHDSDDRIIATTLMPYVRLDEFAFLEVVDVADFGAFLDWGLPKHLFVPKKYQKTPFQIGQKRVIKVLQDLQTQRLIGVEKFGKFLSHKKPFYQKNEKVKLFVVAKTPLGYKVIVENKHEAMLYENEIFEVVNVGDEKIGYIKQTRKDGKIDASLQPIGKDLKDSQAEEKILQALRQNNYTLKCNYKSPPAQIESLFGLSKKVYKRALTSLQEKGAISVGEEGLRFLS
ncbi:MAG: DNA-binding protein [Proteobacteria bacterium]|nr:MAG: DNA-binding protein [Pseudomonadota bacterium]